MPIDDAATRTLRAAGIGLAPRNERLATAAGRHPAREVSYRLGFGPASAPVRAPRAAGPAGEVHRYCARPTCSREAVATMSYDQGARMVYLGGLSPERDPAFYDLCRFHVDRLTPPTGWTVDRGRPTVVAEAPAPTDEWAVPVGVVQPELSSAR
jgi:hypothetical protein